MRKYWVQEVGGYLTAKGISASRKLNVKQKLWILYGLMQERHHEFLKRAMHLCVDHGEMSLLNILISVSTRERDWGSIRWALGFTTPTFDKDLLELMREMV